MDDTAVLWQEYKQKGNQQARETLIIRYVHLAKYVVDRLNIRETGCLSYDDLVSHAIIGLIDALERYDPAHGIRFETYAITRIRGAVVDMLRKLDWVPRSARKLESSIRSAYEKLEGKLSRPATDEEIARELDLSVDDFHKALSDLSHTAVMSLDDYIQVPDEKDRPFSLADTLANDNDPVMLAEIEEQRQILSEAIGKLPDKERLVIGLYYYEGLTLKEIGKVMEVSEARVCQIHTKAVFRLSGHLQRMKPVFCGS